jgi:hypothetical protein
LAFGALLSLRPSRRARRLKTLGHGVAPTSPVSSLYGAGFRALVMDKADDQLH